MKKKNVIPDSKKFYPQGMYIKYKIKGVFPEFIFPVDGKEKDKLKLDQNERKA